MTPLFGPERADEVMGTHTVLLDGQRATFILSVGELATPEDISSLLSWSWSSNVAFSALVVPRTRFVTVHRWDSPDTSRRFTIDDERSALLIFERLASAPKPKVLSAVQRLLTVFRSLRRALLQTVEPADIIRIFNAFLDGADAVRRGDVSRSDWIGCESLSALLTLLASKHIIPAGAHGAVTAPPSFLVREFADVFLERDRATGCTLDANLLLRHASGELYQEAHIELEKPISVQGRLLGIPEGGREKGTARPDARFTAPPLARLLAEQAMKIRRELVDTGTQSGVTVFDPACGSGSFLVEASRELEALGVDRDVRLIGHDQSPIACEMARFCLKHAVQSDAQVNIDPRDSLSEEAWAEADIILMNPPFTSWNAMTEQERAMVESTLGSLYHDHADKSLAFVHKAVESLKPGAVLACVVPAPLLESRAAFRWRKRVSDDPTLSLRLVGCFRGFNYFRGAVVEPAFIVIARLPQAGVSDRPPVQVILANDGFESRAIRQLRRDPSGGEGESQDWSVFKADRSEFSPASWLVRSREASKRLAALNAQHLPTVMDLFHVRLGVRTGHDKAFVFKKEELARLGLPAVELSHFRPVAANATIRSGRILTNRYLFYPYTETGECVFSSEEELQRGVPNFYDRVLRGHEVALKQRQSLRARHWWELVEPRSTWQRRLYPKIVSTYFGQRGSFAYDEKGEFVVTQGFGWIWRNTSAASASLPWAYLAILNSRMFQGLLAHYCPTVRGGQYDLSVRFVRNVPLPDLTDSARVTADAMSDLSEYGRIIGTGEFPPLEALDRAVSRVYGLPLEDWIIDQE